MPIWLRRHTFLRIQQHKEDEADAYKKSGKQERNISKRKGKSTTDIDLGNLADKSKVKQNQSKTKPPTYISRASKKRCSSIFITKNN